MAILDRADRGHAPPLEPGVHRPGMSERCVTAGSRTAVPRGLGGGGELRQDGAEVADRPSGEVLTGLRRASSHVLDVAPPRHNDGRRGLPVAGRQKGEFGQRAGDRPGGIPARRPRPTEPAGATPEEQVPSAMWNLTSPARSLHFRDVFASPTVTIFGRAPRRSATHKDCRDAPLHRRELELDLPELRAADARPTQALPGPRHLPLLILRHGRAVPATRRPTVSRLARTLPAAAAGLETGLIGDLPQPRGSDGRPWSTRDVPLDEEVARSGPRTG